MAKYLARASYNSDGIKGLIKDKASGRRAAVMKLLESSGGKLEVFYFAFGAEDIVSIVELPDNVTAAAFSLVVNSAGPVKLSMTPLLSVEDMDAAVVKHLNYRPPGS
jgi:uncharacterized protein with GYD domain